VEPGPGGAGLDVTDPQVDRRVQVGEGLGHRLDPLVERAGLDVRGLRRCLVAGLDRRRQFLHRDQQERDLVIDVGAVIDRRLIEQRRQIGGLGGRLAGDGERRPLGRRARAVHLVGPAVQARGERAVEPRGQVLPFTDDPLVGDQLDLRHAQRIDVGDDEGDLTGRDRVRGGDAAARLGDGDGHLAVPRICPNPSRPRRRPPSMLPRRTSPMSRTRSVRRNRTRPLPTRRR